MVTATIRHLPVTVGRVQATLQASEQGNFSSANKQSMENSSTSEALGGLKA